MKLKNFITGFLRFCNRLRRPSKKSNLRRLVEREETPNSFTFREAVEEDIGELGKLHAITWAETYHAANPNIELRRSQWKKAFNEGNDGSWFCLVIANRKNELVGFAKGIIEKNTNSPGLHGELNKIYLLKAYQRLGLGRKLFQLVVHRFLHMGVNDMVLFGIPENPSCSFHEAMGGKRLYSEKGNFDGGYRWSDLKKIAHELA